MTVAVDGFLLIDKESGWTSHDVVARIRSALSSKIGHAGTLDPMATGMLVLGIGRSTRLLRFVQAGVKEYLATAQFGVWTDSLDADGAVLGREPMSVGADEVREAMRRFVGPILQVPPMVSARKVEGRRLYALAREGIEVDREARPVVIHELELIDLAPSDYPEVTFRTVCSTGTYIRTLSDDIARCLGGRAHLTALRRTRVGPLSVDLAHEVTKVVAAAEDGRARELMVPSGVALADIALVEVSEDVETRISHGAPLPTSALGDIPGDGDLVRFVAGDGRLLGVYRVGADLARPEVVVA